MKKIIFPVAIAAFAMLGATSVSAQSKLNTNNANSSFERPMPNNSEIIPSKELPQTDGRPMDQIRVSTNKTQRSWNRSKADYIGTPSGYILTQPIGNGQADNAQISIETAY